MKKPKEVHSVRIDPALVAKAHKAGLSLSFLVQQSLKNLFEKNTCPVCKQRVTRRKEPK